MTQKSIYEMSKEELAELSPDSFSEGYVKAKEPLVEAWRKTPYLAKGPAFRGRTQREKDVAEANMAVVLQNTVNATLGGQIARIADPMAQVQESMRIMGEAVKQYGNLPKGDVIVETASVAQTTAWSGATTLPLVLGYVRKVMPKMYALDFYAVQPLDRPTGRVFYIARNRDNNGTTDGQVESRAGWSYRSWVNDPGEATAITRAVTFTITSEDVSVKSRKLQAQTSIEIEQDLRAYFGINNTCPLAA